MVEWNGTGWSHRGKLSKMYFVDCVITSAKMFNYSEYLTYHLLMKIPKKDFENYKQLLRNSALKTQEN